MTGGTAATQPTGTKTAAADSPSRQDGRPNGRLIRRWVVAARGRLTNHGKAAILSGLIIAGTMITVLASLPWWRHLGMLPR